MFKVGNKIFTKVNIHTNSHVPAFKNYKVYEVYRAEDNMETIIVGEDGLIYALIDLYKHFNYVH